MSININNKDSSFFTVASPDIVETEKDLTSKIISLTINEEMGRLPYGTLTLYDPTLIYARILRNGLKLDITWGYKVFDDSERTKVLVGLNSDEISGRRERRGFNAIVSAPSGAGTQGGQLIFNCNFASLGFRGDDFARIHKSGYKRDIISRVFDELGVSSVFRDIRFSRGDEKLSEQTNVRQNETNFQFLVRISYEWRALFRLGHTPKGDIAGIFIDPDYLSKTLFNTWTTGGRGQSNYFDYKGSVSNVISYTWKNNEGENGVGDNVQMVLIDGVPTFLRFVQESEKVVAYRLVPELIGKELEQRGLESGVQGQTRLMKDWLNVTDFKQIKRFFVPIEAGTAPQGFGYEIKAKMLGNPLTSPPVIASFGRGFPERIGNIDTKWYVRKVAHNLDINGYFMDTDIVDAFAITPLGEVL